LDLNDGRTDQTWQRGTLAEEGFPERRFLEDAELITRLTSESLRRELAGEQ